MEVRFPPPRHPGRIVRAFGNLKVRLKLMVVHNFLFLLLAAATYFTLIPIFEQRVEGARAREGSLVKQLFQSDMELPNLPQLSIYSIQEGSPESLGIGGEVQAWLDEHPGQVYGDASKSNFLIRKTANGSYRILPLPHSFYEDAVRRAKYALFVTLGLIYVLTVLLLEFFVLPVYVYRPLSVMLAADEATREGDVLNEMIDDGEINDDEIGQIMMSRNETVGELRRHEYELKRALSELEEKNRLLEAAKRNLEQQDRLVSLGLLSASVAHEMNTPLSVLQGSIERLQETLTEPATQERLNRMGRVASRLKTISESLLDFARVRKPVLGNVLLRQLVDESWQLVAIDEKAKSASFHNEVPVATMVRGNPDRLAQVFVNLLRNALNATPAEAEITITSENAADARGKWVFVRIDDNGEGIPEELLTEIFEAFITTRLDSRGTGLGLTVAEGIVHQHGGIIEASNRPGGGARLEVTLPGV